MGDADVIATHVADTQLGEIRGYARLPPLPGWDITPPLVIQPSHHPLNHPHRSLFSYHVCATHVADSGLHRTAPHHLRGAIVGDADVVVPHVADTQLGEIRGYAQRPPLPGWNITPPLVIQPSHLPLHHPTAAFFHSMALPTTQPTPVSLAPPPGCDCGGCRCRRPACRRHPARRNTGLRTAATPPGWDITPPLVIQPSHLPLHHPTAASSPPPRHHATAASSPPPRHHAATPPLPLHLRHDGDDDQRRTFPPPRQGWSLCVTPY